MTVPVVSPVFASQFTRTNVVVNGGLVLQTMKTDMVKHDVEVESLGKCVDEIDKPTELTGNHDHQHR
ncbi:hypothetical protein Tco_1014553 [Tanacetum coccineum]